MAQDDINFSAMYLSSQNSKRRIWSGLSNSAHVKIQEGQYRCPRTGKRRRPLCHHHSKVKVVRMDEDGREVILSMFGPGEFFGEMSLLDGLARSASVVATVKSELFMIHRRDFLELLNEFPTVTISLLAELAMRLRKADMQIKSLSLKDAEGRVANVLLILADDVGISAKGKWKLMICRFSRILPIWLGLPAKRFPA